MLRSAIAFALMSARKVVRERRQLLTEDELFRATGDAIDGGTPWKLNEDMPPRAKTFPVQWPVERTRHPDLMECNTALYGISLRWELKTAKSRKR